MRFRVSVQAVLAAVSLAVVLAQPAAAQRQSSVQCPDNSTVLISKDVGMDRWAISYRPSTGVTTGNVYTADGGAIFLKCDRRGLEQGQVILSCSTGTGCSDTECPAFEPIGGEIPIAVSAAGVNFADTHKIEQSYVTGTGLPWPQLKSTVGSSRSTSSSPVSQF